MKVLVVYATAGAGHRKAAEAIYHGLKMSSLNCDVVLVDSLDYTNPFFRKAYGGVYTFLITWTPALWGFFFALLDIPFLRPAVRALRRVYNYINARPFEAYLQKQHFDYIISTHFLGNEVAAALKRSGKIRPVIIGVVTDFDVHSIWLADGIDCYAVASPWTAEKIISMGVPKEKVAVTGIPTHENFSRKKDVAQLRTKMNMKQDRFTVLIATGSFGIGPIEAILEEIKDFQVAVICGHNKSLYNRLKSRASDTIKIFGLVNNMDEMMGLSDVMITKPGGLSISEALVSNLPMIFFNAIPGQESNNVKVLASYGVGMSGLSIPQMREKLKHLESSADEFAEVKERIQTLARPDAVKAILSLCHLNY